MTANRLTELPYEEKKRLIKNIVECDDDDNWIRFDSSLASILIFLLTVDQGDRYVHLLMMMRRMLMVMRRMDLQQMRSRLGEGR